MILYSKSFDGRFEKIAQSIISSAKGGYPHTQSSLSQGAGSTEYSGTPRRTRHFSVTDTLAEKRRNADVQPLHKSEEKKRLNDVPRDQPHALKMKKKQTQLGDLLDRRILNRKVRVRTTI
jgi:hypothetical protein